MDSRTGIPRVRRALLTVSDKRGVVELGRALLGAGAELVATGKTALVLKEAGLPITPIEQVSGSPEAFQGRMKTLSFPVCSGILYRRGDASDESDLRKLSISPIDVVVVNFYPFEEAVKRPGISEPALIEEVDIGGPTLVRAAAKNSPSVLVLTDPSQYAEVIAVLEKGQSIPAEICDRAARTAWARVAQYDQAIADRFPATAPKAALSAGNQRTLRYGENPHQSARIEWSGEPPIAWDEKLTPTEISYNNILDTASAYGLASDLVEIARGISGGATGVVIVKHNNPCGVALVPGKGADAQLRALELAWAGDPVSAFGGVLIFTDPLEEKVAGVLAERFIELVAAPELKAQSSSLLRLLLKRKNLKALSIRRFGELPEHSTVSVPGGNLAQSADRGLREELRGVTKKAWPASKNKLALFGVAVTRSLKSNAVTLVREIPLTDLEGNPAPGYQLIGAGQGQPNRVEALEWLAIPRARRVLKAEGMDEAASMRALSEALFVSDAFFPFRDTVDSAAQAGIRWIVQPGGSVKDQESVLACDEHGVSMAFTGIRHFRH